ncbi:P63C domain-containing protein [Mucilaginibacter jinjuensis]|uniref:P63C domain-containing protein n=1 Tax=Mucilaginibacter jinjuensis TaxID=1176721 RepID=A0ABY7TFQ3_9SPHI|nr:P63C domain-containing protein [Mucilaginibacter jinjuensis]WCT14558.1 P63C domain-containing protein [Mucilaginibacter jinjuensis]
MNAAQNIIEKFGGQTELAQLIGKGQSTIAHWAKTGLIPAKWRTHLLSLAEQKGIDLTSEDFDLLPDDFPNVNSNLPKATHYGDLPLNGITLSAAVVDGKRLLSERSLANAFGIKGGGAYWSRKKIDSTAILPEYLSAKYLKPFINSELEQRLNNAVEYISLSGVKSRGIEATVLSDICDVYITAKKFFDSKGMEVENLSSVADNAYGLLKSFAKVGIIALVDEATGYEKEREKNELQAFLKKFFAEEKGKLISLYPDDFFEAVFKMKGYSWKGINNGRKPQWIGHVINNVVYKRIAPMVLNVLREKNPVINKRGYRRSKHTQWIDAEYGHNKLKEHLTFVTLLAKASGYNWDVFLSLLDKSLPKFNNDGSQTLEIDFPSNK